ncbi:MAG: lamin tail domain-containing protein [Dysgonamonadaceae bacterium]|nr:lamin tail domain-containing protein [Dysgonamonadaceae bacterium]
MRLLICTMLFIASFFCAVNAHFSESFSDGNFIQDPTWTGDVNKFLIATDYQLQLSDKSADKIGPAGLSTPLTRVRNTSWEFWVKMDFNPTVSNYSKVYLCSDDIDLKTGIKGFFVRLGHTNKNVALLSEDGTKTNVLIQGGLKRLDLAKVAVKIKVTLDKKGVFSLYSKLDNESNFVLEGSKQVTDFPDCNYFGVVCVYTKTRSEHFIFDDFVVKKIEEDDTLPEDPQVDVPVFGDVIFSEIMAKPTGNTPEYVEFYNCSEKTFSLKNWQFYYGEKPYSMPDAEIKPKEYFVVCKPGAVSYFSNDVKVIGITSFPTLANTGKLLRLDNNKGNLVHWFEYSEKMYGDDEKKTKGGWSLECLDLSNKSNLASNWLGSSVEGGTPGKVNSVRRVNPDTEKANIVLDRKIEPDTFVVKFSKPLNLNTLLDEKSYRLSVDDYKVNYLSANYPQGTEVKLTLNQMPPKGQILDLSFPGLRDLSGFPLSEGQMVTIGSGYQPDVSDVIFNELLPNPFAGSNEYIELYNRSNKVIDLSYLSVASRKNTDGTLNKAYPLASSLYLFYPKQYLLITKDLEKVVNFYNCPADISMVELPVMPSLTNTSGTVVLINNQTDAIVDEFAYNDKMHDSSIGNKKGVALERIDFHAPTNDATNWTSASSLVGYGTPGYENSQKKTSSGLEKIQQEVSLVYINSDEYRINYRFLSQGNRCNIVIFDVVGKLVKNLANNELLGAEGSIEWNGKNDSGQKLQQGIYFIRMDVVSTNGETAKYGLKCIIKD